MQLEGSCQCGAVSFGLRSRHPVPYQLCYCGVCRKQQGGGGFAVNLSGDAATLKVRGGAHVGAFHARLRAPGRRTRRSGAERTFCKLCGSALWLFDKRWPELIHPFASAVDTPLSEPPQRTHIMLAFKAAWVAADIRDGDLAFDGYPEESIAEWHDRHGLSQAG